MQTIRRINFLETVDITTVTQTSTSNNSHPSSNTGIHSPTLLMDQTSIMHLHCTTISRMLQHNSKVIIISTIKKVWIFNHLFLSLDIQLIILAVTAPLMI